MRRVAFSLIILCGCGSSSTPSPDGAMAATPDGAMAALGDGPVAVVDGGVSPDGGGGHGDTYLPWEGGPAYYGHWMYGPATDPSVFPIAVWDQSPGNAAKYAAIGVNTFVGLFDGTTDASLATLKSAGVTVLSDQNDDWMKHLTDPTLTGWHIPEDEPDNAQSDGMGGYGPCIAPSQIVSEYQAMQKNDPTRPIYLNLGQGVAYDDYNGRGSACAGMLDMYAQYEEGADIVSFDIYPVNNTDSTTGGNLWFVPLGVDRLRMWSNYKKAVWNWIETTGINDPAHTPTPQQVTAEVWMSLIHGSMGIGYFCHIFAPSFVEAGLLASATMSTAVKTLNAQIQSLAPALNTASLANSATVSSSDPTVPVDIMVKRQGDTRYLFAVAMRPGMTTATFVLREPASQVEVIDESRTLTVSNNSFSDDFAKDYSVHLYRILP